MTLFGVPIACNMVERLWLMMPRGHAQDGPSVGREGGAQAQLRRQGGEAAELEAAERGDLDILVADGVGGWDRQYGGSPKKGLSWLRHNRRTPYIGRFTTT